MSLKQLEQAIFNLEKLIEKAKEQSDFYEVDSSFNQWFKDFKIRFDAFKKQVVCIPRKQLEEMIKNIPKEPKPLQSIDYWHLWNESSRWFEKLDKLLAYGIVSEESK